MNPTLSLSLSVSLALLLPSISVAATVFDTPDLTGSTVDVTVKEFGAEIGSETDIAVTSGSANLSAEETGGVFSSLELTSGSFLVADTIIVLTSTIFPDNTLNSNGLGFSINKSTFALTPTGGSSYDITGTLNLTADTGTASLLPNGYTRDFGSLSEPFSAALTNSTITITPLGGGTYDYSGELKFNDTVIDSAGSGLFTVSVSSLNTISISGTMIPEPSSLILALSGVFLINRRKR